MHVEDLCVIGKWRGEFTLNSEQQSADNEQENIHEYRCVIHRSQVSAVVPALISVIRNFMGLSCEIEVPVFMHLPQITAWEDRGESCVQTGCDKTSPVSVTSHEMSQKQSQQITAKCAVGVESHVFLYLLKTQKYEHFIHCNSIASEVCFNGWFAVY